MLVMILEKVPPSLRGELSRWTIEPKTGIFVGKVSAMVRERSMVQVHNICKLRRSYTDLEFQ